MSERCVLIGHPVEHSLSPAIHRAAYQYLQLPHRYELCDAAGEAEVFELVTALRRGEIAFANVTVPWKCLALRLADRAAIEASRIGAANLLIRDETEAVVAYNTDAMALAEEIARLAPAARTALIIGNGGAARAAAMACLSRGLGATWVTARKWHDDLGEPSWTDGASFRALGATPLGWPQASLAARRAFDARCQDLSLLIQATSAGMHGAESGEALAEMVPWALLPDSAVALDLVYNPKQTPFLAAARRRGLSADNGLQMLVGQALCALEVWQGRAPPRALLCEAAERALAGWGPP